MHAELLLAHGVRWVPGDPLPGAAHAEALRAAALCNDATLQAKNEGCQGTQWLGDPTETRWCWPPTRAGWTRPSSTPPAPRAGAALRLRPQAHDDLPPRWRRLCGLHQGAP